MSRRIKFKQSECLEFFLPPLSVAVCILLAYLVHLNFTTLPIALRFEDEANNPDRFIAERAVSINARLSNLGTKVLGSHSNQVVVKEFLLDRIRQIIANASSVHTIEYEVQTAEKGVYHRNGISCVYQNIENIVVRLRPSNGRLTESSLLVNTHYDSVPVSFAGSDAGFMVVVMLEILRILSQSEDIHKHSIVFLFNGAEEAGLIGSHAFITQHRWAKDLGAFINLDSAGSGGKENLFQVTPGHSWIMKYYKGSAAHPVSSVWMEESFRSGLIPSDTDFRVFRDYGHIAGVDLAISSNGYVYHTSLDRAEIIPSESYQHTGDNILELTKALANADELNDLDKHISDDLIFTDVLGIFMITYTTTEGIIINCFVSAAVLIGMVLSLRSYIIEYGISYCRLAIDFAFIFAVQILSICIGIGFGLALAAIYDALGHSMAWFSNQWLCVGLYICPLLAVLGLGPAIFLKIYQLRAAGWKPLLNVDGNLIMRSTFVQIFLHAHALIMIILCLILTGLGIRSAYIITLGLVFYGISIWVVSLTKFHVTGVLWIWIHLATQIIPYIFYINMLIHIVGVQAPIQGRIGSEPNPDLMLSVLILLLGVLFAGFLMPVFSITKRPILTVVCIFVVLWLISVAIMFSPVGFPYRATTQPQRYGIMHTDRTIRSFNKSILLQDHGFILNGFDHHANDYLDDSILQSAVPKESYCDDYAFCAIPRDRYINSPHAMWRPSGRTSITGAPTLNLLNQTRLDPHIKQYNLELSGPDHMIVVISPMQNSEISNWTLDGERLEHRPDYGQMLIMAGNRGAPLRFSIFIKTTDSDQEPSLDIAVIGNFVHHESEHTTEFRQFVQSLPTWIHATPTMTSYQSWEF